MPNKRQERFSPPAVGGISLLVVFAVLCLTVFALLALTTVQADVRLADSSAQSVAAYYAADCQAQEILARLRAGEVPEGVTISDGGFVYDDPDMGHLYADYAVPISETLELQVRIMLAPTWADYVVEKWQAVPSSEWEGDETIELWDEWLF